MHHRGLPAGNEIRGQFDHPHSSACRADAGWWRRADRSTRSWFPVCATLDQAIRVGGWFMRSRSLRRTAKTFGAVIGVVTALSFAVAPAYADPADDPVDPAVVDAPAPVDAPPPDAPPPPADPL